MVWSLDEVILPTLTSSHCFEPGFNWTGIAVGDADDFFLEALAIIARQTMLVDVDLARSFASWLKSALSYLGSLIAFELYPLLASLVDLLFLPFE